MSISGPKEWRTRRMTKIYDLSDPTKPSFIRDFGLPGQQPGSTVMPIPTELHGPISLGPEGQSRLLRLRHEPRWRRADRRSTEAAERAERADRRQPALPANRASRSPAGCRRPYDVPAARDDAPGVREAEAPRERSGARWRPRARRRRCPSARLKRTGTSSRWSASRSRTSARNQGRWSA